MTDHTRDARGAMTDEELGRFLLPLMRKHLSPVAIDHLKLGDEPTIGTRKLARALLTEARSDGFKDCIDAIRGAITFGQQDTNHAPTDHWLAEFWDIGRRLAAPRQPGEVGAGAQELSEERIQKLWDDACKDGPGRPGWSRHIRFAKAVSHHAIAAFLDRTGQYVTNDASREAAIADALAASAQQEIGARAPEDGHAAANCDAARCSICAENYPELVASAQQDEREAGEAENDAFTAALRRAEKADPSALCSIIWHAATDYANAQQVQADAGAVATPIPGRHPLHYTGGCFIRYVELPDGVKMEHVKGDTWRIVVHPSPTGESDKPTLDQLTALLPGSYYMDPPDGGSVTLLEQLQRMASDAARYLLLRRKVCIVESKFHIINIAPTYIGPDAGIELDASIDFALRAAPSAGNGGAD